MASISLNTGDQTLERKREVAFELLYQLVDLNNEIFGTFD